jgi:hypothetical protein
MRLALAEAERARAFGEVPVGATNEALVRRAGTSRRERYGTITICAAVGALDPHSLMAITLRA